MLTGSVLIVYAFRDRDETAKKVVNRGALYATSLPQKVEHVANHCGFSAGLALPFTTQPWQALLYVDDWRLLVAVRADGDLGETGVNVESVAEGALYLPDRTACVRRAGLAVSGSD